MTAGSLAGMSRSRGGEHLHDAPLTALAVRLVVGIGIASTVGAILAVLVGLLLPHGLEMAFVSDRSGNEEVYVIDFDHSLMRNMSRHPGADRQPLWSPDGTRLAFISDREGTWNVYVMDADGGGLHRLSDTTTNNHYAAWSPDGRFMAYSASLTHGTGLVESSIYVVDLETEARYRLPGAGSEMVYAPVWSRDGSRIRYDTLIHGGFRRYHVRADGTDRQTSTPHDGIEWLMDRNRFKPAGFELTSLVTRTYTDICVLDSSETIRRCIGAGFGNNIDPVWRPMSERG